MKPKKRGERANDTSQHVMEAKQELEAKASEDDSAEVKQSLNYIDTDEERGIPKKDL